MKIYHTETQADYDALMVELEAEGCFWSFGDKPTQANRFVGRKGNAWVRVDGTEVNRAHLSYYKQHYPTVPITKYKAKVNEMKFTKENVFGLFGEYRINKNGIHRLDDLEKAIMDLDDTPEKVVVPKFVDWWIRKCRELEWGLKELFTPGLYDTENAKLTNYWLFNNHDNQEIIVRAWLEGYEVEKEPLYHVVNKDGGLMLFNKCDGVVGATPSPASLTKENYGHKPYYQLTEKEIKNYDERYWPFAVKVDAE